MTSYIQFIHFYVIHNIDIHCMLYTQCTLKLRPVKLLFVIFGRLSYSFFVHQMVLSNGRLSYLILKMAHFTSENDRFFNRGGSNSPYYEFFFNATKNIDLKILTMMNLFEIHWITYISMNFCIRNSFCMKFLYFVPRLIFRPGGKCRLKSALSQSVKYMDHYMLSNILNSICDSYKSFRLSQCFIEQNLCSINYENLAISTGIIFNKLVMRTSESEVLNQKFWCRIW